MAILSTIEFGLSNDATSVDAKLIDLQSAPALCVLDVEQLLGAGQHEARVASVGRRMASIPRLLPELVKYQTSMQQAKRPEETSDDDELRERLRHVYWIGGGTGAGKSAVALQIASKHGLYLYATDEVMAEHARRSTPQECPRLSEFMSMDMDERWLNRSPETMLETFHWFHGEAFHMIIEDLLLLPSDTPIIVEGLRLLPHLVKPLLSARNHAVWLLPTPKFREAAFEQRGGWASSFVAKTSDPAKAFGNLLKRDSMFTERLRTETQNLDLIAIEVDTMMTEQDSIQRVTTVFAL